MKSVGKVPYLLILHGDCVILVDGSIHFKEEAERFDIGDAALR
jgi:hypothetical protein